MEIDDTKRELKEIVERNKEMKNSRLWNRLRVCGVVVDEGSLKASLFEKMEEIGVKTIQQFDEKREEVRGNVLLVCVVLT